MKLKLKEDEGDNERVLSSQSSLSENEPSSVVAPTSEISIVHNITPESGQVQGESSIEHVVQAIPRDLPTPFVLAGDPSSSSPMRGGGAEGGGVVEAHSFFASTDAEVQRDLSALSSLLFSSSSVEGEGIKGVLFSSQH